mmetsp:Transcript_42856/g.74381  ORF Transcript_42856/g.74381 Transcript_42856/m.74381 type:complete len:80 (+) Transcript_42856:1212-1451(+)
MWFCQDLIHPSNSFKNSVTTCIITYPPLPPHYFLPFLRRPDTLNAVGTHPGAQTTFLPSPAGSGIEDVIRNGMLQGMGR